MSDQPAKLTCESVKRPAGNAPLPAPRRPYFAVSPPMLPAPMPVDAEQHLHRFLHERPNRIARAA
jgi:hypothetical protein